jgi:redox-sensitive bicupin YhaK (pirin superfamily)
MERKVRTKAKGYRTVDGAGVNLVRVLSRETAEEFDPFLMLDSFDSRNPDEYTAGFPMHPHRGIETISYICRGKMIHRDSLGNTEAVSDGELQWMNSGSGIIHEEMIPPADRLLGVQLWLNLPARDKMCRPGYHRIKKEDIQEIPLENGRLKLLAGSFQGHTGYLSEHLPLNYYSIELDRYSSLTLKVNPGTSVLLFTLVGSIFAGDEFIEEKTAAKLTDGDTLHLRNGSEEAQVLFIESTALHEPIAWGGPIVMNTRQELQTAFEELNSGTFLKESAAYREEAGQ